jgi:hypothetical protein
MTDTDSSTPSHATSGSHLGFRLAVGAVGVLLLALFVLLGSVAMKQSATQKSLETREATEAGAPSDSVRE